MPAHHPTALSWSHERAVAGGSPLKVSTRGSAVREISSSDRPPSEDGSTVRLHGKPLDRRRFVVDGLSLCRAMPAGQTRGSGSQAIAAHGNPRLLLSSSCLTFSRTLAHGGHGLQRIRRMQNLRRLFRTRRILNTWWNQKLSPRGPVRGPALQQALHRSELSSC
jgi:hypothetical protein